MDAGQRLEFTVVGVALIAALPLDGRDAWPAITEGAASPHDAILLNTEPSRGAIRVGLFGFNGVLVGEQLSVVPCWSSRQRQGSSGH